MLDHLSFGVRELTRAIAFYDAALAPLGVARVWTKETAVGYGPPGGDDKLALKLTRAPKVPGEGFHLAFTAKERAAVDAFHHAALRAGGVDVGAPGLRPQYGPGYYAAFVDDPDGHRLEAVFHEEAS